jgi:hypothetical protein
MRYSTFMVWSEAAFSPPASLEAAYQCREIVEDAFCRIGSDASLVRGVLEESGRRIWHEVCHEQATNDISVYTSMAYLLDTGARDAAPRGLRIQRRRIQQTALLLGLYLDVLPGEPTLITHNASHDPMSPQYWYGVSPEGGLGIQVSERFRDADPYIMLGDQRLRPLTGIDPAYSHKLKGPARKQSTRIYSGAAAICRYVADEIIQPGRAALDTAPNRRGQKGLQLRRAIAAERLAALAPTLTDAGVHISEYADRSELKRVNRKINKYSPTRSA